MVLTVANAHAQAGRAGLSFLKLGVGGRALGMGEAYAATAADPTATHYNPAALALTTSSQILLMHKEWIQDAQSEFLGAVTSVAGLRIGVSINSTNVGNIEIRKTPGPSEGTFTARNAAFGLSAALPLSSELNIGVTGRYLYEKILIQDANGLSFDLGGTFATPWGVQLGLAVQNLGSMNELDRAASKLPTLVRGGGSYCVALPQFDGSAVVAADIVSYTSEGSTRVHLGGEFNYQNALALRMGVQLGYDSRLFTAGTGFRYGAFNVDYAFVPLRNDLGTTHTVSLGITI
jgi:hypothetical protein